MFNRNEIKALIIIAVIYMYYSVFMYIPTLAPIKTGAVCLLWIIFSVQYAVSRTSRHSCKLKAENYFLIIMAIFGVIYIISYIALGFIDGFGFSMYDTSASGIITNIALLGSVLVMREWVRDNLINSVQKKYKVLIGILVTITFTFTELNLHNLSNLESFRGAVEYLSSDALPKLAINAFLTYAVYVMGYKGAVIYIIITRFPVWFLEYLPNLKWITMLILGVAYHVYCVIILNNLHVKHMTKGKRRSQSTDSPFGLLVVCVIIVALSWFALGVFPVYPISIVSESMSPIIHRGDMVLVNEVDYDDIIVGDIILYQYDEVEVLHRVVSIEYVNGVKLLHTKGDANNIGDITPINQSTYRGKHIATLKYIGYPGIWAKQTNSDTVNEINGVVSD